MSAVCRSTWHQEEAIAGATRATADIMLLQRRGITLPSPRIDDQAFQATQVHAADPTRPNACQGALTTRCMPYQNHYPAALEDRPLSPWTKPGFLDRSLNPGYSSKFQPRRFFLPILSPCSSNFASAGVEVAPDTQKSAWSGPFCLALSQGLFFSALDCTYQRIRSRDSWAFTTRPCHLRKDFPLSRQGPNGRAPQ